jgi:hypothetical protein
MYTASRVTQTAAEREHLPLMLQTLERKKFDGTDEETDGITEQPLAKWSFLHRPTRYKDGSIPLYVE